MCCCTGLAFALNSYQPNVNSAQTHSFKVLTNPSKLQSQIFLLLSGVGRTSSLGPAPQEASDIVIPAPLDHRRDACAPAEGLCRAPDTSKPAGWTLLCTRRRASSRHAWPTPAGEEGHEQGRLVRCWILNTSTTPLCASTLSLLRPYHSIVLLFTRKQPACLSAAGDMTNPIGQKHSLSLLMNLPPLETYCDSLRFDILILAYR